MPLVDIYCGLRGRIMNHKNIHRVFLLVTLFFTFTACTREVSDKAKLSIQLPDKQVDFSKVSSLAAADLTHVVINIRDDQGVIVKKFNWDSNCHDDKSVCQTAPSNFDFDLKKGSNFLFQVLGVYEDANENLLFSYGDATKSLSSGVETVLIVLNNVSASAGREATFGGRFLTGANSGPSGALTMSYQPPNGVPEMEIMDEPILNGWFNAFSIEGAPFKYTHKASGVVLFNNVDIYASVPALVTPSAQRLKLQVPENFRSDNGNIKTNAEGQVLFGYFGPYVASHPSDFVVCYEEVNDYTYTNLYTDTNATQNLLFDSMGTVTADSMNVLAGGDKSAGCMSGAQNNKMFFNHAGFDGWLGSALGFSGAFKHQDTGNSHWNPVIITDGHIQGSVANLDISWKYLDDVYGNSFVSTTAFVMKKNVSDQFKSQESDSFDCQNLYSQSQTFSAANTNPYILRFDATTEDAMGGQTQISLPSAWLNGTNDSDKADVVLCPFKSGRNYINASVNAHGIHYDFPSNKLNLKLVGSGSPAESNYHQLSGIGVDGYSFMKSNISSASNNLKAILYAESINSTSLMMSQYISFADISLVEATLDAGVTWVNVGTDCASAYASFTDPSNNNNMMRLDIPSLISDCSTLNMAWGGVSSDSTLKLRFIVDPTKMQNYGLGGGSNNIFTTGDLVMKSDQSCSAGSITASKVSAPTTAVGTANFMDEFFISNGTDLSMEYQLVWAMGGTTVCTDSANSGRVIRPIINAIDISSMPACFNEEDLLYSKSNPFSFTVSPTDSTGANCDLNAAYITVGITGDNAGFYTPTFAGGDVISHSTLNSSLINYLVSDTSITSVVDSLFTLDHAYLASGSKLGILSANANTDFNPTDNTAPASIDLGAEPLLNNPGVVGNSHVFDIANTFGANDIVVSGGGSTGTLNLKVLQTDEDIIYVGKKNYKGDSPLIVTLDATYNIRIYVHREGNMNLNLLFGPANAAGTKTKAIFFDSPGSYNYLVYNTYQELVYVALSHDGMVASTDAVNLNAKTVKDFQLDHDGTDEFILAVTDDGFNDGRLFYLPLSSFDGSTWTHPASNNVLTDESGKLLFCGANRYMQGIWNANYSALIPFSVGTGSVGVASATTHSWGDATSHYFGEYDKFSCTNVSGEDHFLAYKAHFLAQPPASSGRIPFVFKTYQEGSTTAQSQQLINDANTIVDFMDYFVTSSGVELWTIERPTDGTSPVLVKAYIPQLGVSTYTYSRTIASFPNDSTNYLNGISVIENTDNRKLIVYGQNGQLYFVTIK